MTSERVRDRLVGRIADQLIARQPGHPLRVAVDGVTAAGKTTFASALAAAIGARGRKAIHLSMDGFHHRSAHRHRQGRDSAQGYYQDAYDFPAFAATVLVPLGPGGDRRYRTGIIDLATDQPVDEPALTAEQDAVLVVDGSFLQRAPLAGLWDEVVFLETGMAAARERGTRRDAAQFGGLANAERAYEHRYHAASLRYLAEEEPAGRASILVDNEQVRRPVLRRIGGDHHGTALLFSYGTLRLPRVQAARFGRELAGVADTLPGHRADWITITDPGVIAESGTERHPIVRACADPAAAVPGTVFTVSATELAAADEYEAADYRRNLVRLSSGTSAWAYLAGATQGPER